MRMDLRDMPALSRIMDISLKSILIPIYASCDVDLDVLHGSVGSTVGHSYIYGGSERYLKLVRTCIVKSDS